MIFFFFFSLYLIEVLAIFQSSNEHVNWKLSLYISTFKWIYLLRREAKGGRPQGYVFIAQGSAQGRGWRFVDASMLTWHYPALGKE